MPNSYPELRNPPVIEAWISFEFEPNESKVKWDKDLARKFIEYHRPEFPKLEIIQEANINVKETSPDTLPEVISREYVVKLFRMSNDPRTRIMQLGDDALSFHVLRSSHEFPRYSVVKEEVVSKLQFYLELFRPSRISNAALNFLDIIEIPAPSDDQPIYLKDYFIPAVELPSEPFGNIAGVSFQFLLKCPYDPGMLFLRLKTLTPSIERKTFRFQMEWSKQIENINTISMEELINRCDSAYRYTRECFFASFKPKTLELFSPVLETT